MNIKGFDKWFSSTEKTPKTSISIPQDQCLFNNDSKVTNYEIYYWEKGKKYKCKVDF